MPCTYYECIALFTEHLPWLKGEDAGNPRRGMPVAGAVACMLDVASHAPALGWTAILLITRKGARAWREEDR